MEALKTQRKLRDLLRLLAYQVGSEVSYQEIGRQIGLSADTVISYIDLLEKSYVIFRLSAFSRNLRKEVSKKDKVFFYDNGVRNILIDYIEEHSGKLFAYEFKLHKKNTSPPQSFLHAYPNSHFHNVHMENWLEFVT